ncbi:hypothetical protein Fmac_001190 [Flemingia macrophylla]|uniref:Beta-galactosidase beta-sandwich domain-containing protein n=1 Tax=Flemingia macrophylla TaxID=520843 RepID=A0ABD1NGC7_9FABA
MLRWPLPHPPPLTSPPDVILVLVIIAITVVVFLYGKNIKDNLKVTNKLLSNKENFMIRFGTSKPKRGRLLDLLEVAHLEIVPAKIRCHHNIPLRTIWLIHIVAVVCRQCNRDVLGVIFRLRKKDSTLNLVLRLCGGAKKRKKTYTKPKKVKLAILQFYICAAFISNVDDKNDKTVQFRNASYHLPAWSVSILPDCMNVVFNTAKVTSQKNIVAMIPESLQQADIGVNSFKWGIVKEKPGIWGKPDFVKNGFVDLINTTKDTTDYLWHRSRNIEAISLMPSITIFFKQRHIFSGQRQNHKALFGLWKMMEHRGNLIDAFHHHFLQAGTHMYGNLVRQNFAVAQLYHNNAAPSNQNLEISTFVNAARTFRPSLLLDAYYRKELRDLFRNEAMLQAAIEASKMKGSEEVLQGSKSPAFNTLLFHVSSDGGLPHSHFQKDDDLVHEQEKAFHEHLVVEEKEVLGAHDLLDRGKKTNSCVSQLECEAENGRLNSLVYASYDNWLLYTAASVDFMQELGSEVKIVDRALTVIVRPHWARVSSKVTTYFVVSQGLLSLKVRRHCVGLLRADLCPSRVTEETPSCEG